MRPFTSCPGQRESAAVNEAPRLFELRTETQSLGAPGALAVASHLAVLALIAALGARESENPRAPAPEYEEVVFRTPPKRKPMPKLESGGSGVATGAPEATAKRRELRAPKEMPAPPSTEPVLGEIVSLEKFATPVDVPDSDSEDSDGVEDQGPALGSGGDGHGSGFGSGSASGSGFGRGAMSPRSKARRAWFTTNQWKCERPDRQEKAGRVMVRVRVTVQPDGRPSRVVIVQPGAEIFDLRAMQCATAEDYVSALDEDGTPMVGVAEFAIQFL